MMRKRPNNSLCWEYWTYFEHRLSWGWWWTSTLVYSVWCREQNSRSNMLGQ